jgi:restriction endonuclease S subunit
MQRYEKYKPSGIEWLGDIPEHWNIKKLKYVAEVNSTTLPEKKDNDFEIEYVDISSVNENGEIMNTKIFMFLEAPSRARRIIHKGDTIVSTVRTYLKAISFIAEEKENLICSTGFAVIRPRSELQAKYLFFIARSQGFIDRVMALSKGVSYPAIDSEDVKEIPVWYPDVTEQDKIVHYIENKIQAINKFIDDKESLIYLLNEERTAIISHAVTKGINPNVKLKPSGIAWLGEIPEHWEVMKLKYVLRVNSGDGIKPIEINPDGAYPVYGGNGILGYTEKYNSDKADIIVGRVGAKCGNVKLVTGKKWISDNALQISITGNNNFEYMSLLLESMNLNSMANQNAQPLITGTMIKEKKTILPPLNEQNEIVQHVNKTAKKIDNTITQIEKEIELMQEYRTALINEAVTGKIKVDLDLQD